MLPVTHGDVHIRESTMKKLVAMLHMLIWCLLCSPFAAGAVDAPHYAPEAGYTCGTCHTAQLTLGSTGYNNICLNCHRPGDPAAGARPITLADTANPFGSYSTSGISKMYQTSHRWDGSDTSPVAGALPPLQGQMTTALLRARTGGQLACVRCHSPHLNTFGNFLRTPNDQDQLCLDCHRTRNVQSHRQGSHPVGVPFRADAPGFNPAFGTSANLTAEPANFLKNGMVTCSTCHGVHFVDSRSSTVDGRANFARLSSGDGYILRSERRGAAVFAGDPDRRNICTSCHAGKKSHNMKGQDIQCGDCHAAHVEYDPEDPSAANGVNIFLVKRAVPKGASGSGRVFYRYTGSRREYRNDQGTGVCQGCHAVPAPGGLYPDEHASREAKVCTTCHSHNSNNGSFSGACTACHGYPPLKGSLGGPAGLALPATGATTASPGGHETHAKKHWMACATCHAGSADKAMPSATVDIGFTLNGTNFPGFAGSTGGGVFNATPLNSGYSWSMAAGTTLAGGNNVISCNVYCHGSTLSGGTISAPVWTTTDGSQKACGTCHAVTAAGLSGRGSHLRHAGSGSGQLGLACAACHGSHDNNDHVNGSVTWDLSGLAGGGWYRGSVAGGTGRIAPSSDYGQCSNLYCHSNGTTLQPGFNVPRVPALWGGAALGCNGCHDGLATGPAYPNTSLKANSHDVHVVANGYGCNLCHYDTTTTGTSITSPGNHVNRVYNIAPDPSAGISYVPSPGSPTTPSSCSAISCHGGNSATWGVKARCQDCHLTAAADRDDFAGTFWNNGVMATVNQTAWTTSGHGRTTVYPSGNSAAVFSTDNACEYCHDRTIAHKTATNPFRLKNFAHPTWGKNGVCLSCHGAGSPGVFVDGVFRTAAKKVSSYHVGAKHTAASNGGQFCWDCHDGHGDGNLYMIHDNLAKTSDSSTGAPSGALVPVSFVAATTGSDYAVTSPPFTGICNVCHTTTAHYTALQGDGHNVAIRCTACHAHNGAEGAAFSSAGGYCNSCHGYPPARADVVGSFHKWSSARAEEYPGGGGAHTVNSHVSAVATPADGFSRCDTCHNPADHAMSPLLFLPGSTIKVRINQELRFEPAHQARYSSNGRDGQLHQAGTCTNISCHFGATPRWDQR
jgi:predicted CxxxxCH...CXXCH cytochrome family protein